MNKSIIITSTGRSGTTFLIILYTLLGFNTGYKPEQIQKHLFTNCNSGMEKGENDIGKIDVIKNPLFLNNIHKLNLEKINFVIIPIRNFERSAKSREYYKNCAGGLLDKAKNWQDQVVLYNKYLANYIQYMVLHEIPTIFIDFEKMVTDTNYLYDKLKYTFSLYNKNISIEFFNQCFQKASNLQSKRTPI